MNIGPYIVNESIMGPFIDRYIESLDDIMDNKGYFRVRMKPPHYKENPAVYYPNTLDYIDNLYRGSRNMWDIHNYFKNKNSESFKATNIEKGFEKKVQNITVVKFSLVKDNYLFPGEDGYWQEYEVDISKFKLMKESVSYVRYDKIDSKVYKGKFIVKDIDGMLIDKLRDDLIKDIMKKTKGRI
jgi:hypothetical protein